MDGCNTLNSILSIRIYINSSIILLPTILLSLLCSTLFRTFQCPCMMISSCAHLPLTRPAGITFAGLSMCSTISFPITRIISTKNIFGLFPSFNLKPFKRQQLYEIWPYMVSIIIRLFVYDPIYSLSNLACSHVHLNIDVRMYDSVGQPFLLMKSISSSQFLTSGYGAWSCFRDRTISLPFDTQQITTMNIVFGNSGRLLPASSLACSPKSVTGGLLPRLPFFHASQISLAHFFKNISTHCRWIHSALSKLSKGSQLSNVPKKFATAISQCRGSSLSCFNRFCSRIMDQCFFSRNPATHTFFHLLNAI